MKKVYIGCDREFLKVWNELKDLEFSLIFPAEIKYFLAFFI